MKIRNEQRIIVAHFDHGIREDSAADARFVEELAKGYQVPFVSMREELGPGASEELARSRRYAFLKGVAKRHNALLITAHHQDDLIETIAINLVRGTGWRGLDVFGDETIKRPLIHKTKAELYDYALRNSLEWIEDETNQGDTYLRNRIRKLIANLSDYRRAEIIVLWQEQRQCKSAIDRLTPQYLTRERYPMIMYPEVVALEILRFDTGAKLTRPQLRQLLHAIKVAKPGTYADVGNGIQVSFSRREFIVENTSKLL